METIDTPFTEQLLQWYGQNARDLPWRREPSPYHIWLSEIMLQQTRVETVISYYERFLSVLPNIAALADAPEEVYMKLWEGLGYYSRVKNLHKAAVQILEQYGGQLPHSYEELLQIAGIGPYTAAAIASIAFGQKIPSIDGNLLRVFARLCAYDRNIQDKAAREAAQRYFLEHIPDARAGDFNQALMDLGSAICLPNGVPRCECCPVRDFCRAFTEGNMLDYPKKPAKKKRAIKKICVFLLSDGQRIALRKRSAQGLLAGLYEFPNLMGRLTRKAAQSALESLGLQVLHIDRLPSAKHIFTHKEWHMQGYLAQVDFSHAPEDLLLCDMENVLEKHSIPSAFRVYKDCLRTLISNKNTP